MTDDVMTLQQVPTLSEIYGAGVVATFGILAAMYQHAHACRAALELTPLELHDMRVQVYRNLGFVAIGIVEWGLGEYNSRARKRLV